MIIIKCNHCDRLLGEEDMYFALTINSERHGGKAAGHVCAKCRETMIEHFHLKVWKEPVK